MKTILLNSLLFFATFYSVVGQNKYEAEDGVIIDATVKSDVTGFSGTGYVEIADAGTITIIANVDTAGTYPITLGYRSDFGDKNQGLLVNDILVKTVVFVESSVFTTLDVGLVDLVAGDNTIQIKKDFGYMELDFITVEPLVSTGSFEMEVGEIVGAEKGNEGTGFSGTGYVVFKETGSIIINVDKDVPGVFPMTVGYRASFGGKTQDLYVNDVLIQEIAFPESEEFTTIEVGNISLTAGINKIEFRKNFGFMDLDFFSLGDAQLSGSIEAEDGSIEGLTTSNVDTGFSGEGYVVFGGDDGSVIVNVERAVAGSYDLSLGYKSPFGDKKQTLYVNGVRIKDINFIESEIFTTIEVGVITLNVGVNTIEIRKSFGFMDLDYFLVSEGLSTKPIADAGFQQVKMDINADGVESFSLDASGTIDLNDDIVSYAWSKENGDVVGIEKQITFEAGIGESKLMLKVVDADGNESLDDITLYVGDPLNGGNNRIGIVNNTQKIFASGINLAWNNFAEDVVDLDADYFEAILDTIQENGGNTMRWWLHTNGAKSPIFDDLGNVTGLDPNTIPNMKTVLDFAYNRGISVSMCLWSFDMLEKNQKQDLAKMKIFLEDVVKTQTYIDNALIPILQEIGDHPAILTWEIFNEAENMTEELGYTETKTTMAVVQRFVNLTAGAIHTVVPSAMVSTGAANFDSMTDIEGHTNYYTDDRLIAAGGDPKGTLDFYQVHYYPQNFSIKISPFHRPADWWGLDKPIVIGEFPSKAINQDDDAPSYTTTEAYKLAYEYGYAGAMAWDYRGFDGGSFETSKEGISYLAETYPEAINILIDPELTKNTPVVVGTIPDLNIFKGAAEMFENYASMDTIFFDKEDGTMMEYTILENSNPEVATGVITPEGKLNITLMKDVLGKTIITIQAKDSDDSKVQVSFRISILEDKNLALLKPIVASSFELDDNLTADLANDGDMDTRWGSIYEDNQWIYVDLLEPTDILTVKLFWEVAYAVNYEIQVSDDATTWETVFTETNGDGDIDEIKLDKVKTRYVRMKGNTRGSEFGFSLYEFEIYGDGALSVADNELSGVYLYPNPVVNTDLNLQVKDKNPISVELMDVTGRNIASYNFKGSLQYTINTTQLVSGFIVIKISGDKGTLTKKIIKK